MPARKAAAPRRAKPRMAPAAADRAFVPDPTLSPLEQLRHRLDNDPDLMIDDAYQVLRAYYAADEAARADAVDSFGWALDEDAYEDQLRDHQTAMEMLFAAFGPERDER